MTACPTDDVLGALVQRTLDDAEAREVTSHLDACDACRQVVIAAVRGGVVVVEADAATPVTMALGTPLEPRVDGASPELAIGARVGRYELRELLGSGGMGRVYAAYDAELDRSIALKVMRPDLAGRASVLAERLVRESQLMAKIVHPAVIAVHDVGRAGDAVFIAMDLVRGDTLGAYVRRAAPGWRETLALLAKAGEGLAAAHARGVVHRDFKPDNVLVELGDDGRVGRVVVTDFGVARAFADEREEREERKERQPRAPDEPAVVVVDLRLTATGTAVGTPAYMAPEHMSSNVADERADVWAFAVTAWELLFGE
ncbi:MAG: protein kinase, partial [Deltaproteobacteria bacterium]|nr:protein kinase [Deltaproteobacteria bacterium]